MSIFKRIVPILLFHCPHCCRGATFSGLLQMNTTCPNCGIVFEREHGYFLNSMFIGYALDLIIFAIFFGILYLIGVVPLNAFVISALLVVLLIPVVFRYARVLWMHIDEVVDPREEQT